MTPAERKALSERAWLAILTGIAEWTDEPVEAVAAIAGEPPPTEGEADDAPKDGAS